LSGIELEFPDGDLPSAMYCRDCAVRRRRKRANNATSRPRPARPPTAAPAIVPVEVLWVGISANAPVLVNAADESVDAGEELALEVCELLEVADEVETEDAAAGRKSFATAGFEERNPAVTSPLGHPVVLVHGLDLQQPKKGGSVVAHVYHSLPLGHSWSLNFPMDNASKDAGSRLPSEQPP